MKHEIINRILSFKSYKGVVNISDSAALELAAVYEMCTERGWSFHNCTPMLLRMIEHNVEPNWCERVENSKMKFKNDSSSLESYENRYGVKGKRLREEKIAASKEKLSKEVYSETHGTLAWEDLCASKASIDEASFIRRYGDEVGKQKREEYLEKWTKSVKSKGGWGNGLSLESFVERDGKEEGLRKWDARRKNQRKRFSKEWFEEKYGEESEVEWEKYCQHMSELSIKGMDSPRRSSRGNTYSKKSQNLFWSILKESSLLESEVLFAEAGNEKKFKFKEYQDMGGGFWFSVDFLYKDKVIEFDGTYWHSLARIEEKDSIKEKILRKKGYQILRITEEEYDENPLKAVDKCVHYLMEKK